MRLSSVSNIIRISVFLLIIILKPIVLVAQGDDIEIINSRSGLSQNDVSVMYQDSEGFMWFGTDEGLNRYDGKEYRIYGTEDGLPSGLISALSEDKNKNLWVGTLHDGVCRLNLVTGLIEESYRVRDDAEFVCDEIHRIATDHLGNVLIGTQKGVGKLNFEEQCIDALVFDNFEYNPETQYISGFYVEGDSLWIFLDNRLYLVLENEIRFEHQFEVNFHKSLMKCGDTYVISSGPGIYSFRFRENEIVDLSIISYSNFSRVITGPTSELYCVGILGMEKYDLSISGSYVMDKSFTEKLRKHDLMEKKMHSVFLDRTGILYMGLMGKGIIKYNPNGKKFNYESLSDDGTQNTVRCIFQDKEGVLYIASDKGLFVNQEPTEHQMKVSRIDKESFNNYKLIFTIAEVENLDGENCILVGGDYGNALSLANEKSLYIPNISARIFAIEQDPLGYIWLGTYGQGVYRYYPHKDSIVHRILPDETEGSLASDIVRSFCLDSKNRLWIGTGEGISMVQESEFIKRVPEFVNFRNIKGDETSLSHDYILPIFESKAGEIWVGTFGGGLNRLLEIEGSKAKFKSYTKADGLPNNVIKTIVEDDQNNLWLSTNRGLCRFSPHQEVESYDVDDGLQDIEFFEISGQKLSNGLLTFGGVSGLTFFDPENMYVDSTLTIPAFSDFFVLNRKVNVGAEVDGRVLLDKDINSLESIRLKHFENSFAIKMAPLHFANPARNRMRYMLENFDKDWIVSEHGNIATYTNIDPGTYIFKFQAGNSSGVCSEEVKELKVVVIPPVWQRWYMKVLYFVFVLFLLWFFRRYTIIDVKKKHELLVQVQTIILEKEKRKIEKEDGFVLGNKELSLKDEKFITTVLKIVQKNISNNDFTITELAERVGVSQPTLNKNLLKLTGLKGRDFLRSVRMRKAAQLLQEKDYSIGKVTELVGYSDAQYFRETFKEEFGYLPSEYKATN